MRPCPAFLEVDVIALPGLCVGNGSHRVGSHMSRDIKVTQRA